MKIGFLINPVAGMGGTVALKGTDGEETLKRAIALGAIPKSGERAKLAILEFKDLASSCEFLTASGEMGENLLTSCCVPHRVIYTAHNKTTSCDTKKAAEAMLEQGADILLFAGGDGTARDICSVVKDKIPVVGIPAGVKIHSGVYAKRPTDAGRLMKQFLNQNIKKYYMAEVMDIDEEAFRNGVVKAKLYGYMSVPDDRKFMQERKSSSPAASDNAMDLASFAVSEMKPDSLYLVGSGTTTAAVMKCLSLDYTLLGIDALKDKKLLALDMTETEIEIELSKVPREKRFLMLTVIGGQGHIFGRGNQQLSPKIIRMIPVENIFILATQGKISEMMGKSLLVDTGDNILDEELRGYKKVITGFGKFVMAKVE